MCDQENYDTTNPNRKRTFKGRIREWLDIEEPVFRAQRYKQLEGRYHENNHRAEMLEKELRDCMKYIGAIFDHLGVRPKRTFIQDFSRLPAEEHPTVEVIQVVPAEKPKQFPSV